MGPTGGCSRRCKEWLAWNEPNNPLFLAPQYEALGKGWMIQSAIDYAKICNAVYNGVHATLLAERARRLRRHRAARQQQPDSSSRRPSRRSRSCARSRRRA